MTIRMYNAIEQEHTKLGVKQEKLDKALSEIADLKRENGELKQKLAKREGKEKK